MSFFIILLVTLFAFELAYFFIANKLNIIDKPNERSSHTAITLRGGGIIFSVAWVIFSIINGWCLPYFTIGLIMVAAISFVDDLMTLSSKVRIIIHLLAFTLCFYEMHLLNLPLWQSICIYIVAIGCMNAVNFMDGINGMTGMYALSVFVPMFVFYDSIHAPTNPLLYMIASVIVFGFFNFRKKAVCFAGDVGSISMAFIFIFFILGHMTGIFASKDSLSILRPNQHIQWNFTYILLLTLYGIDAILTIIQRLYGKENIFKPHRKHLYQLLANECKIPHVIVSGIYAGIQAIISYCIFFTQLSGIFYVTLLMGLIAIYILVKVKCLQWIESKKHGT